MFSRISYILLNPKLLRLWTFILKTVYAQIKVVRQVSFSSESQFQVNTYCCDGIWEGKYHKKLSKPFQIFKYTIVFLLGLS